MTTSSNILGIGDSLPPMSVNVTNNSIQNTKELKGNWSVLYFYPKDNTPGCTTQAIGLKENWPFFCEHNINVIGVSKDSMDSHDKFKSKFELPFELLSDTDLQLCNLFGVYQEKSMYGKKYMGIVRSTFIIDPTLKLTHSFIKISPKPHADKIIKAINSVM